MTPLSRRYQPHLAALLVLALVPVTVHSYAHLRSDDCADLQPLPGAAEARPPDPERDRWIRVRFDAESWWEGRLDHEGIGASLRYTVIRSYNAKRLYYIPERRLFRGAAPAARTLEWIDAGGTRLPIHRPLYPLNAPEHRRWLAAYLLVYEGEPVANPYLAQLIHAPVQLLRGSRPMTLFLVLGEVPVDRFSDAEEHARQWLRAAWESFEAACGP